MSHQLPYTEDDEANELLANQPFALLIGIVLYQQVPIETAFLGPLRLKERLGGELDSRQVAGMDPEALEAVFKEKPAIHRFPGNMAKRVQAVAQFVTDQYDGDAGGVWQDAIDADDLMERLTAMPGFGEYKARIYLAVLGRRFGIRPSGWETYLPDWPNISEIETSDDRVELKVRKKEWKASQKA
ncbi:MAG: HhH-GPD-type base excision DNA repair protein [Actinomycetota bacterium]|nr:HhH-GPD-type base excision DNA repair protein [Actinomycetota bacterium]